MNANGRISAMELHLYMGPVSELNNSEIGDRCFCSYSIMDCLQLPQGAAGETVPSLEEEAQIAMVFTATPGYFAPA